MSSPKLPPFKIKMPPRLKPNPLFQAEAEAAPLKLKLRRPLKGATHVNLTDAKDPERALKQLGVGGFDLVAAAPPPTQPEKPKIHLLDMPKIQRTFSLAGHETPMERDWREFVQDALKWFTEHPLGKEVQELMLPDAMETAPPKAWPQQVDRHEHALRLVGALMTHAGFIDPVTDEAILPDSLPKFCLQLKVHVVTITTALPLLAAERVPMPFDNLYKAHRDDLPPRLRPRHAHSLGGRVFKTKLPRSLRKARGRKRGARAFTDRPAYIVEAGDGVLE